MTRDTNSPLDVDRIAELREIIQLLPHEALVHAIFSPPISCLIPGNLSSHPGVSLVAIPPGLSNSKPKFMPKPKTGFKTKAYKNLRELDDQKSEWAVA